MNKEELKKWLKDIILIIDNKDEAKDMLHFIIEQLNKKNKENGEN